MAHIGDYAPGLIGGMVIAGVILTALTALLQFRRTDRFAAIATVALFVVFCEAYPLIVISDDQGLLRTILYVVLLAYAMALLIRRGPAEAPVPQAA